MYNNNNEWIEIFTIMQGIMTLIMMIVFLFMARNVSQIKKRMGALGSFNRLMDEAERQVFYGNMDKATELYHMAAYKAIYDSDATALEIQNKLRDVIMEMNKAELVLSKALDESVKRYIKD